MQCFGDLDINVSASLRKQNLKFAVSFVWGKAIFSPIREIRSALNPMDYSVAVPKLLCIMILDYRMPVRHWAYSGHCAHIAHHLVLSLRLLAGQLE